MVIILIFAVEKGPYRFDRDTHQITSKTEKVSLANGGPYKARKRLSCKAGGLQRRRTLKSFLLGVSSHHRYGFLFYFISCIQNHQHYVFRYYRRVCHGCCYQA